MFAFLPIKVVEKFFRHVAACMARRREALYAEREARRRQARYVHPRLEGLEGRIVPDAYSWTGAFSNAFTDQRNWNDNTDPQHQGVPGSMDTATIPAGTPACILNSTSTQTVAGLTVGGRLDVGSKLSVTTLSTAQGSIFNVLSGGEVDVLGSGDLGGGGTISGQIDAQGSYVTFDPTSSMTAATGATLSGSLFNVFGPLNVTGALTESANMVLDNNGGSMLGSLTGTGSITDGAEFDWDGGAIGLTGSGGLTFIASAYLKIQGSDAKTLSAGTLTNQCNGSEIGGTGGLTIDPGATFDNLGNPTCNLTIPTISTIGSGVFINDADAFLNAQGATTIFGNFINRGTLTVDTGSTLTISSGSSPTDDLDGTIQLNGDLILRGTISSPTGFIEDAGGGTLKIGDGSAAGVLTIGSGYEALLDGFMEVTSTGRLTGPGEVYNNGKLTLDVGATTSIGSYQQTSTGTLDEQASGPGQNPVLTVSGNAQLSGTLELDFIDGYTPRSGDAFTILTAGSIGAHFDTTPDNMTVAYGPTSVTATEN
jgi:hypothetical protein